MESPAHPAGAGPATTFTKEKFPPFQPGGEALFYERTIAYKMTIDHPKIFTASWTEDLQMKLHPESAKVGLYEFVCEENNRCAGGHCEAK